MYEIYSKMQHLKELVTAAKVAGVSEIYIHGFTGNDSSTENAYPPHNRLMPQRHARGEGP